MKLVLGLVIFASVAACGPAFRANEDHAPRATPTTTGVTPAARASTVAVKSVLTAEGFGKVAFGMPLADAEKLLSEKVPQAGQRLAGNEDCRSVFFKAYPQWRFMVEHGVVTRADAFATDHLPQAENAFGIHLGDSLHGVLARYPAAEVQPHKYDPTGHYLKFASADGKRAIVMEEGGGKITAIRGGLEPSVEYVEGCL